MTRSKASEILNGHMALIAPLDAAAAIVQLWAIAFPSKADVALQPIEELRPVIEEHLVMCDLCAKGNDYGSTLWRDAASAIRWTFAQAEALP